ISHLVLSIIRPKYSVLCYKSQKKTYRSEKVVTEEVQKARVDYWERIRDVAREKLVFIDESGLWVGMSRP
ncbi:MAG: hypothetical protein P5680_27220, partial [Limnospira sp. PMC 737.11]|nr:hypothetical protein [Limnospira sp. PMC 737.11]